MALWFLYRINLNQLELGICFALVKAFILKKKNPSNSVNCKNKANKQVNKTVITSLVEKKVT